MGIAHFCLQRDVLLRLRYEAHYACWSGFIQKRVKPWN
jgi:hypothetical protein